MTTPTHAMPASRPDLARVRAARGSSKEPGTQCTSMRSPPMPAAVKAATAPSASFFEIASLKRAATTAKRAVAEPPATPRRGRGVGARPAISVRERREEMAHLLALGSEVASVGVGGRDLERHPLDDTQAVAFDADDLLRVVGQVAEVLDAEVHQDLRADAVVPKVRPEAEGMIGFHRVLALILQLVRAQLVDEPDPPPLLPHIHEHSAALA